MNDSSSSSGKQAELMSLDGKAITNTDPVLIITGKELFSVSILVGTNHETVFNWIDFYGRKKKKWLRRELTATQSKIKSRKLKNWESDATMDPIHKVPVIKELTHLVLKFYVLRHVLTSEPIPLSTLSTLEGVDLSAFS